MSEAHDLAAALRHCADGCRVRTSAGCDSADLAHRHADELEAGKWVRPCTCYPDPRDHEPGCPASVPIEEER